ncbi:MAG TPA: TetR/AcrR family transcriptional regulator [Bauldia sp.]|nr:TetR/AcrR family transcriptional regulator [Bauldia sp.]
MADVKPPERKNQRIRTRKDLLTAAGRLMKEGRKPSLDEVAEAALVSRATAYRYFPNIEALLIEAALDIVVPDGSELFVNDPSTDPLERIDRAEAAMHRATFENEAAIRLMLASSVGRDVREDGVPVRQNRRTPLIQAALAPARARFDDESYARLCAALALIFGSEAMVVFRDVLGLDGSTARKIKSWAVRALVRAALEESRSRLRRPERKPAGRKRLGKIT